MQKGRKLYNFENFSDLNHVFFKKKDREETLENQTQYTSQKKVKFDIQMKTLQASATPLQVKQNIQNQMLNQKSYPEHQNENENEEVVQLQKEDSPAIQLHPPQEIAAKNLNQQQVMEDNEREEEKMDVSQEAPDLDLNQIEFYCEVCQKQYKNKKTFNSHIQTKHNETKPFTCPFCQKRFKRPDYLQKHKESHKEENQFPCDQCDLKFKSKHTLEKHVKTVHKRVICGKCKCCNKGFTRMDYLKKHLQRGQQNHKCVRQGCGKKFASKQSMERHITTQHQS